MQITSLSETPGYTPSALQIDAMNNALECKRIDAAIAVLNSKASAQMLVIAERYLTWQLSLGAGLQATEDRICQ